MSQRPDLSKLTSEEKDALIYALLARVEELERRLGLDSKELEKKMVPDTFSRFAARRCKHANEEVPFFYFPPGKGF